MHPKRKSAKSGVPKRPTVGTHAAPAKRPRIAGVGTRNSVPQFNEPQDDEPQNDEPQGDDDFDPTARECNRSGRPTFPGPSRPRFHRVGLSRTWGFRFD